MVERLTALLHEEAADVDVPAPPAAAILRTAHRRNRRRRAAEAVAGLAAVAVVVGGVGGMLGRDDRVSAAQDRFASASAGAAYRDYGAFSIGSTVYVGNHKVTFSEKIKSLYYTSVGVLVRMGEKVMSDESGPSHYTLIRPDGSTRDVDLRMGDRVPGTDPSSPYVTYAEPQDRRSGSTWDLVAVDLSTGAEVARTTVHDQPFTWGGWEAPPVTTHDTRMWALVDAGWLEYDWSSGTTRMIPGTAHARLEAAGGRFADPAESNWDPDSAAKGHWTVRDFATDTVVREITLEPEELASFSPDGRYVRINAGPTVYDDANHVVDPPGPSRFVNVETGRSVPVRGDRVLGWTPTGDALAVDPAKDQLSVCDTDTGRCSVVDLDLPDGKVKLGGLSYES